MKRYLAILAFTILLSAGSCVESIQEMEIPCYMTLKSDGSIVAIFNHEIIDGGEFEGNEYEGNWTHRVTPKFDQ